MKKIRIIQLCSTHSFYNDNLQNDLNGNSRFNERFEIVPIYLDDLSRDYCAEHDISFDKRSVVNRIQYYHWILRKLDKELPTDPERDFVHVQYVGWKYTFFLRWMKKHFHRIILSYWGSDLLCDTAWMTQVKRLLHHRADAISFETDEMAAIFNGRNKNRYAAKIRKAKFGLPVLDFVERIDDRKKAEFKQALKIPVNSRVVVIGYNGRWEQRHLEVMDSIRAAGDIPPDVYFVFPLAYGSTPEFNEKVRQYLQKYKLNGRIIDKIMPMEQVAVLRCISDVMIQVQTTDALSGSMLETLFAGGAVITGSWLPYEEMDRRGIRTTKVDDVSEVGKALFDILNNPLTAEEIECNRREVYKMSSREACTKNWIDIYESLA